MRTLVVLALAGLIAAVTACAPKTIPVPVVTTLKFPDFVMPAVPPALAGSSAAVTHDRAWRFLQAGDLRNAERELARALKLSPAFYPADTASGYLELARKDAKAALPNFERALERQPDYASALVGRGHALVALNRDLDALGSYEAAIAADPALVDIRRLVEVFRFRGLEKNLANARQAARSGRLPEAARAYEAAIASSPDSAFLYRELAAVERVAGAGDRALEHFRKAVELEPGDAASLAQIAELLEARGDVEGALLAYRDSLALEANDAVAARRDALVAKAELAKMPEQYRAIETAPQITRGDVAALIGVRLGSLLPVLGSRAAGVMTDVRRHWAETWILAVARAGVMEPYDNHTFQPRTIVRRVDLAQAVGQLLAKVAAPEQVKAWESLRTTFPDLSTGHLAYAAASLAVASGVMSAAADGRFEPSRTVSGREAIEAIERLQAMAGVPRPPSSGR